MQQNFSASELAENLNKNTERDVAQFTFKAILNNSLIMEKFSTWLMAVVGASCALIIANINNIALIVGQSAIKYSLISLVVSGLLGFLAKFYSIEINIILNVDDILRNTLSSLLKSHIEEEKKIHALAAENRTTVNTIPDIIGAMRIVIESVPWYRRKKALKEFERGLKDPLHGYKRGMRFIALQAAATVSEFACFLGFILIIAITI